MEFARPVSGPKGQPLDRVWEGSGRRSGAAVARVDCRLARSGCVGQPFGPQRKTAEIALRNVPAMPEIVPELAEINVGGWQGLRRAEIEKLEPRLATGSQSERFEVYFSSPGGESYDAFSARIRSVLEAAQRPTVIVAHGIVGRVLRGLWLGLERSQLAGLPGGQGCIFHLKEGREEVLWPS